MEELYLHINTILNSNPIWESNLIIGNSVNGKPIYAHKFGSGKILISLIAGNHSDEPTGPLLLRKLVGYLKSLPNNHSLLKTYSWYIVPHTNPDGEEINNRWFDYTKPSADLYNYLKYSYRELPGKDLEFGYPIKNKFNALRPENSAVYNFWKSANSAFNLHVSLHGMQKTYGSWFLVDEDWVLNSTTLQTDCKERSKSLGYYLHDLNRFGEKGFNRISEGFYTRPNSVKMREHFLNLNDKKTAAKFHPSSMESIRSLGGDCLTLVSELPLFLYPKKERELIWPDPYLTEWNERFSEWKIAIHNKTLNETVLRQEMETYKVTTMPYKDQMKLQWQLICSGIKCIENKKTEMH